MIWFVMALIGVGQPQTPSAFLQQVYAGYRSHEYNPFDRLDGIFAPQLAAAIREDERLANGEVGYLDGDPLCDCQDYQKLTATVRILKLTAARKATAAVDVNLGLGTIRHLRVELLWTGKGWRVADIKSGESASLLRDLQRSNRSTRR